MIFNIKLFFTVGSYGEAKLNINLQTDQYIITLMYNECIISNLNSFLNICDIKLIF